VRFAWHPTFAEIPGSFTEGEGDFLSKIVDFRGDTNVMISVPYLKDTIYCPSWDTWTKDESGSAGAISISIVNTVTSMSPTGSSNVYVNCYIAGHENMDFIQPSERLIRSGQIKVVVASSSLAFPASGWVAQGSTDEDCSVHLNDIFAKDFPTIVDATTQSIGFVGEGEKVLDILSLLHRFIQPNYYSGSSLNATWVQFQADSMPINSQENLYVTMTEWFLYQRGSLNYKILKDYNAANSPQGMIQTTLTMYNSTSSLFDPPASLANTWGRNGTITEDTTYKPSLEFKTPWVNRYAFVESPNRRLTAGWDTANYMRFITYDGSLASSLPVSVWFAVGDDFSFGWPSGAPIILG